MHLRTTVIILSIFCLARPTNARATVGVDAVVVSETNGEIVVELVNSGPAGIDPVAEFFVALPAQGTFTVQLESSTVARIDTAGVSRALMDSLRARAASASDTLQVSPAFAWRGVRAILVRVRMIYFPAGAASLQLLVQPRVRVQYTPASVVHDRAAADPFLLGLVVNRDVFPADVTTTAPDPWFSLSPQWVRIPVTTRGMVMLRGDQLRAIGVPLESIIDPASFRLYSHAGQNQPREFVDPNGSWRPGKAMREVAIAVEDGGDGFDNQDRILFYGLGTEDWLDYYDTAAPDTLYHRHTHAKINYYYLTWDGALPGTPLRIATASSPPSGGSDDTTYVHREYRERDLVSHLDYRGDGWLWLDVPPTGTGATVTRLLTIPVRNLDASQAQTFRTLALAQFQSFGGSNTGHHARYTVNQGSIQRVAADYAWDAEPQHQHYEQGLPVRRSGFFLFEGDNEFRLVVPRDLNPADKMFFAWFSIAYRRQLVAAGDAMTFTSADSSGLRNFRVKGFSNTGAIRAFDVTDPWSPFEISGLDIAPSGAGRRARFSSSIPGRRHHFEVIADGGMRVVANMQRIQPAELRAQTSAANMVIICNEAMRSAAEALRSYRLTHLPGYVSPVVSVVTTRDIYENYSGGMPDPMAIRNYLRRTYDSHTDAAGNRALSYVLLFGDASVDFRNNVSQQPDLVPTNLYFTLFTPFTFATDEWYAHLDDGDQAPGRSVADVAVGRLPVATTAEAAIAVNRIIAYETAENSGTWRNRAIMAADDELSSFATCELDWTLQSERLTYFDAPGFLDVHKIYLTEYKEISGVKPEARFEMIDEWNAGALLINFIGHGSSQQMADELLFLGSDVTLLNNGLRLPMLMAMSCTIGDFANPTAKSMSENLILSPSGGVIATITASRESYPAQNFALDVALWDRLLPRTASTPSAVGIAAASAKASILVSTPNAFLEENSWKYNLLGDPAMRLRAPRQEIRFDASASDTLVAGLRKVISGSVVRDGNVDASFNGTVRVRVEEPQTQRVYLTRCLGGQTIAYRLNAGSLYDGTADVSNGRFTVDFRVPRSAQTGPLSYITAYATSALTDAAATEDSLFSLRSPTIGDSTALRPGDGPPRVSLGFKSGLKTVKGGETVRAVVRDRDGINILATSNEGRQAILFDDLTVPIDVNDFFSFDHGGTDTSGVLLYPLPQLAYGKHRLIYKVSDSFGQTALDTLVFQVTDPSDFYAEAVFNYPNPFQTETSFLFRVSDRATIRLDLFTVSGRRIRRLEESVDAGEAWIRWDGRDTHGGEIANGSYLYVATVDFPDVDRPPVVLRGSLSRIR